MSENPKIEITKESSLLPSCLHCRAYNLKREQYQQIFDEVGLEVGLPQLLSKYFQLNVKHDKEKEQLLCQECINTLIRFFDIDELQREQDAAKKGKTNAVQLPPKRPAGKVAAPPPPPLRTVASKRLAAKRSASAAAAVAVKRSDSAAAVAKPSDSAAAAVKPSDSAAAAAKPSDSAAAAAKRSDSAAAAAGALPVAPSASAPAPAAVRITLEEATPPKILPKTLPKTVKAPAAEQEQISALIQNILDDDEESCKDNKFTEAAASVRHLDTQEAEEEKQMEVAAVEEEEKEQRVKEQQENKEDEMEFVLEHEDGSSELDLRHFKVQKKPRRAPSQSQNESQSDDDSLKVEPFNFVLIKETDDIDDLYEYLSTVVKTCFETLTFDWATVCRHCLLKFTKYENLLAHMVKRHKLAKEQFKCPIEGCSSHLKGYKSLAMHLVVLHAPVADIPIYGSCPECNMTFSNILQYNKHSCAHVIKKRRGIRLYCEMCGLEFPSWKRFNFHNQFHLERHRPRACFVCNYADYNIDELFQHLHYAHEPEGTLFCDLCDRQFRDAAVFTEHNKSHSNVSSTTYSCSECNANFETRGRLNGHMRSTHGSVISCELCSREFATEATYNIHMKKHLIIEREVHVCNSCGLLSENHAKMVAHVEKEESVCYGGEIYVELMRDAYVCEYCSAYFKTKADLRAHRDSGVHKNGFFWCQPCGKEFGDMKLYRHHMRNYQQQRADLAHRKLEICLFYMCDYEDCCEAYINWNSLYTHKRRTHDSIVKAEAKAEDNEWICQFCQKVCRSKMSLSVHVARSHNNNNITCDICKASYKDEEALKKHHAYWHEPMECALCLKIVKNRRNYDTHMNVVHSNNKRYSCSVCQKGFYHKSEMEAHKRLHNQLYTCEQCSFTTRNKKSLSVHVLGQHYKRYAFECKVCNKRFGRRQGLSNHMQRAHGSKYTCKDFITEGCNKSFISITQLNVHVRKVHNTSIFIGKLKEDGELDGVDVEVDEMELELQEDEQDVCVPSSSKRRSIRFRKDTHIELIAQTVEDDNETSSDNFEDYPEIKRKKAAAGPPPKKWKKKN